MTDIETRRPHRGPAALSALESVADPLDSVVGLAEMLCDRSRDVSAAARNEIIEQLAIRAKGVQQVVRNVITARRLADGKIDFEMEPVDLRSVLEAAAGEWTVAANGARISVTGSIDAVGDPEWVAQAVHNILDDAAQRGARVIDVSVTESHSKVVVDVVDDGIEIPDSDLVAIGEPYQRVQAADWDGVLLGVGVAVARGLARGMGGDLRCHRAGGRNECELILPKHSQRASRRGQLPDVAVDPSRTEPTPEDLSEILVGETIATVYQTIVDIRAGGSGAASIIGYESFARFPYATPPDWFDLAGTSGLGVELELLAVRAGIDGFSARDGASFLALNLSNGALLSPRLAPALDGMDPGRLVLELSDTARIRSYEITRRSVDSLREMGVRLAVDDVGADEIDMWHILRLEPEIIKLDRHLVADQHNVRRNNALIRGLTTMARDLGILLIAEAIETEEERQRLLELGVEFGQGYLFGRPEPLQWKSRVLGLDD